MSSVRKPSCQSPAHAPVRAGDAIPTKRKRGGLPRGRLLRATLVTLPILGALAVEVGLEAGSAAVGSTSGSLEGRIAASQAREGELNAGIGADTNRIEGFQGSIEDLQSRLASLESSLAVERELLASLREQLKAARTKLAELQVQLGRDRRVLVAQVVAAYEAPPPDIVTVILQAHGFADLIERLDDLRAISRQNAAATVHVAQEQKLVSAQAQRLATLEASHARETSAVLVQRDEVAQLHLALVTRQLRYVRARDRKSAELSSLQSHKQSLEHELTTIQTQELEAAGNAYAYTGPTTGFGSSPEGDYGFFPAPGTDYAVGEEPTLASHLNALGVALHLHLIGISGYRSPTHSVEVGGFADDPHTRGEASDTPGVEGVPQSTLARFGLIRPFPGAAEADHIQLLGSKY
jgi:peptidoglycan hydrolase CwlO-like protein